MGDDVDKTIAALEEEIKGLAGKDNKKARTDKEKEKKKIKDDLKYIDACKVVKGLEPKNGNFTVVAVPEAAPVEEAPVVAEADKKDEEKKDKKEKPKKAQESAGISKAERDELEKLKTDIIARKKELKEQGMSGGQCNKDEQVVAWVARMNELKEKESPGSTAAGKKETKKDAPKLSGEAKAQVDTLEKEIEEYRQKLVSEFKYSKKDIAADPDMMDMQAKLKKLQGKK